MARLCTHTESGHYLMALDAGTGSVRAVIFDLQGKQIAVGQAEWQHLAVPDVPGSMEFDLAKNWQLACQCIRQALQKAAIPATAIAAVSACSMREGIVIYDSNGEPIWACANVDARAAHEVSELKELHDNTFEEEVYRCSGQTLALSAIPRLLWLAHHRPDYLSSRVNRHYDQRLDGLYAQRRTGGRSLQRRHDGVIGSGDPQLET